MVWSKETPGFDWAITGAAHKNAGMAQYANLSFRIVSPIYLA
jgi:hypothetical protein